MLKFGRRLRGLGIRKRKQGVAGIGSLVLAGAVLLAIGPAPPAAASAASPWISEATDRLKTLGVLPLWLGVTRPVSSVDLRVALQEASGHDLGMLSPDDQILLELLRREVGLGEGSSASSTALMGKSLVRAYGIRRDYVSLAGAVRLGQEWTLGWAVDSATAGLWLGEGAFFLGRERMGWGPGGEGGLLFSGAAGPFDRIEYSLAWHGVRYTKLVGWLDGGRSLVAARADWMVRPNMRIGFSESIVIGGAPYWVFIVQPVPILVNQILSHVLRMQKGIDDNYLGAIDVEWLPHSGLRVFGEVLIDDITLPPNPYPSRLGATVGFQSVHPGDRSLLLQYTIVPNWTYSTTNPGLHYALRGMPLGHPLGADFDALHMSWRSSPDRTFGAWVTYVRKGEGQVGRIWTDLKEATMYPSLRGVVEYSTILGLDLPLDSAPGWAGTISPWVRLSQNAGHVEGVVRTDWGVEVAWQSSF